MQSTHSKGAAKTLMSACLVTTGEGRRDPHRQNWSALRSRYRALRSARRSTLHLYARRFSRCIQRSLKPVSGAMPRTHLTQRLGLRSTGWGRLKPHVRTEWRNEETALPAHIGHDHLGAGTRAPIGTGWNASRVFDDKARGAAPLDKRHRIRKLVAAIGSNTRPTTGNAFGPRRDAPCPVRHANRHAAWRRHGAQDARFPRGHALWPC